MAIRKEIRGRLECYDSELQKWKLLREGRGERSVSVDDALKEFYGKRIKIVIEEVSVC